jgi:hypothetical protein
MAMKNQRSGGRKVAVGPYSRSYPTITPAPGDRTANKQQQVKRPRGDQRVDAGSFSGDGMSEPLPRPRSGLTGAGGYRPITRAQPKRYL